MTRAEMQTWLSQRYKKQCEQHPRTAEIDENVYISVNLSHMSKSPYWKARPFDEIEAIEWRGTL